MELFPGAKKSETNKKTPQGSFCLFKGRQIQPMLEAVQLQGALVDASRSWNFQGVK
jgi:hypothetical protein